MNPVLKWFKNRVPTTIRTRRSVADKAKYQPRIDDLESRVTPSTVVADQADYAPGSTATFTGAGFQAGESVQFSVVHTDSIYNNTYAPWVVTDGVTAAAFTDGAGTVHLPDLDGVVNGGVQTTWQVGNIPDSSLKLTATGLTSGDVATTTFTDAAHFNSITVGSQTGTPTYGQGNSATFAVSAGFNGSGGTINVGLSLTWNATNPGVTVGFSPSTVTNSAPNSTLTLTTSATTVAGSYGFTVTGNDGSTTHSATGTLVITKAGLTITASNTSKTYGNTITFAGTEFTSSGLVNGDMISSVTLTSTGAPGAAAVSGSPYAIVPSNPQGINTNNYNISLVNGTLTVSPASLTITASDQTKTYGDTFTFTGSEFSSSGLVNSDSITSATITSSGAAATATVAGSPYLINIASANGTGLANYNITYVTGEMTVDLRDLTVTANSTSKTYGDTVTFAGTEFSTQGLANSDTVDSASIASDGAAATALVSGSPYAITIGEAEGTGLDNYNISYVNGGLSVSPKDATITADSFGKTYGDEVTFEGDEFSTSGFVNDDGVSSVTLTSAGAAATATVAGSPYDIVASDAVGTGLDNYNITYQTGSLSVGVKFATVAVSFNDGSISTNSTSKTYGDTFTFAGDEFEATGFVNGDTVDSVDLASDGAAATASVSGSPYVITIGNASGEGLDNYDIIYVEGSLTVNPAELTITANSTSKTYGDTVTFAGTEFSADGLVNSDTVDSVTLTSAGAVATAGVDGSPYAITPSNADGTGLDNYDIIYVDGDLDVDPLGVTITGITANNKNYDGTTQASLNTEAAEVDGLINGDDVSADTSAAVGTFANAGPGTSIPVTITGVALSGPDADNYFIIANPTTTADINDSGGAVVINGTGDDDNLEIFSDGPTGDIGYILNHGAPVYLTGITSFTFNGLGGDDTFTIDIPEEGALVEGSVSFDGGEGVNTLVVDNAFRWSRITPVQMDVGSVLEGDTQNITYSNVNSTAIDNASAVGSFYGPNTEDRADALSGLTPDQSFAQVLYLNILGRAGDTDELNYWVGVLHAPGNSQITVAQQIEGSFEGRERIVVGWYANYLNREADSGEQAFWANYIISHGQSEEQALGLILGSPEFYSLTQEIGGSGTPNERYATAMYQILLQRTPSAGEVNFWANTFLASHTPTDMANLFLASQEYRVYQAESYYQTLLLRTGDAGGLHFWGFVSTANFYTMRTQFESTAEFYAACQAD